MINSEAAVVFQALLPDYYAKQTQLLCIWTASTHTLSGIIRWQFHFSCLVTCISWDFYWTVKRPAAPEVTVGCVLSLNPHLNSAEIQCWCLPSLVDFICWLLHLMVHVNHRRNSSHWVFFICSAKAFTFTFVLPTIK